MPSAFLPESDAMVAVCLMLAAMACWLSSGLLAVGGRGDIGSRALGVLGGLLGASGALLILLGGEPGLLSFPFAGMRGRLEVDALSAAFLLPLHLVAGLGVFYGQEYWPLGSHKGSGP